MRPEFSAVHFGDPQRAERNLDRLEKLLAPGLFRPLASLLQNSPDPGDALNRLERYATNAPPRVLADLAKHPTALTYLVAIFGYSGFLAETFLAEPELAVQFARGKQFAKLKSKDELMQDYARFATTNPDPWLSAQLARFKRRNYLRIALKDVLGLSTLGETTLELSALADVILENAYLFCVQELDKRYGHPQFRDAQGRIVRSAFSIVSLGKLGGNELNYSSDIDLLFLYGRDGETSGGSEPDSVISNKEFFVRLAHAVTRTITQPTHHGEVFRVDLRLRPEGEQGDLAISLNSAAEYYEHRAREWELQMLIKARHSAGDARLTREFLRRVDPYIYGAPTDFDAVEAVLLSRERISRKLRESGDTAHDVKLHRGGIRDIEFLTQCLQRLYGGQDPWVRSGGTLFALRKLYDKRFLSDADYATLTSCYEFFRKVEHRIQLEMGKQTHRLPADREALERLARRVGLAAETDAAGGALRHEVQERFERVDSIYQRLIHPRAAGERPEVFQLASLAALGPDPRSATLETTLGYLNAHAPEISHIVREVNLPERAQRKAMQFLAALLASSERYHLARSEPEQVRRALRMIAASDYLAELLIHHPEELELLGGREKPSKPVSPPLGLPVPEVAEAETFAWVVQKRLDYREKMALLRRDYRRRLIGLAWQDLEDLHSIYPALARWSALAGRAIASALAMARNALANDPAASADGAGLMVLGLGRLGLHEFDLGSDADLVFVAPENATREDVAQLTRVAEKTIEALSSYTQDGSVFAVDTRLRPRGREGDLVTTTNGLLSYLGEAAQPWEGLTYLKIAPLAGDMAGATHLVERIQSLCLERFSSYADLDGELQRMRRRLEKEVLAPPSNVKTAPGGYYDVDFAVSYLRLHKRVVMPAGVSLAEQVALLRAGNVLSPEDAEALTRGAAFLRTADHAVRLVTGRALTGLPEHVGHAEAMENLARAWGLIGPDENVAACLRDAQQRVRYVYRRLLGAE